MRRLSSHAVLLAGISGCTFALGNFAEPETALVYVESVSAPFPAAHAGQKGLPLVVTLVNQDDRAHSLRNLVVLASRDGGALGWDTTRPYPMELPAGESFTLTMYLAVDAFMPPGFVELNASGFATDADGASVSIPPADVPATVVIGAPPSDANPDSDGDGLDDETEQTLGTDPDDRDSDSDGLDDGVEAPLGVPYDSDGDDDIDALEDDSDNGGEPDLLEWRRGGDPRLPTDDVVFADLLVTDVTDAMDGDPATLADPADAGPTLSMREALAIAANRAGPDRVRFDPSLAWPILVGAISTTTSPTYVSMWPHLTDDTFIDGGGARIDWPYHLHAPTDRGLLTVGGARVTIRGLEVVATRPSGIGGGDYFGILHSSPDVSEVSLLTIANVRFGGSIAIGPQGRGIAVSNTKDLLVYRSEIFARPPYQGLDNGIMLWWAARPQLIENTVRAGQYAVYLVGNFPFEPPMIEIRRNRLSAASGVWDYVATNIVVAENQIGPAVVGVDLESHSAQVHDNDFLGPLTHGVRVGGSSHSNSLRRNRISGCAAAPIQVQPGGQDGIAPPAITSVVVERVSGTHNGADGTIIEVFSDPDDDAGTYLGFTTVTAGAWEHVLTEPLGLGETVSATATDAEGNTSALSAPVAAP